MGSTPYDTGFPIFSQFPIKSVKPRDSLQPFLSRDGTISSQPNTLVDCASWLVFFHKGTPALMACAPFMFKATPQTAFSWHNTLTIRTHTVKKHIVACLNTTCKNACGINRHVHIVYTCMRAHTHTYIYIYIDHVRDIWTYMRINVYARVM